MPRRQTTLSNTAPQSSKKKAGTGTAKATARSATIPIPLSTSSPLPTIANAEASKKKAPASHKANKKRNNAETSSSTLTLADWVHCVGMVALYTCQGLVQATTFLLPLSFLHINKGFSKESIGLLGLPGYAFSFKFVWAPVVDLVWSRALCPSASSAVMSGQPAGPCNVRGFAHRRLQWTVLMQLCIFGALAYLYRLATTEVGALSIPTLDDVPTDSNNASSSSSSGASHTMLLWELIADNHRPVWDVVVALFALSFCNATQDIAVDAWAVEGLSAVKSKHAGTLQFVGLTIGMTLYSIFTNFFTADSKAYPISLYFVVVGAVCLVCVLIAVFTAMLAPLWMLPTSGGGGVGDATASDGQQKKVTPSNSPAGSSPAEPSLEKANASTASSSSSGDGGTIAEILRFLRTPSVRNVVLYLLSRGFFESSNALMGVELMSLGWTSTANTATVSLVSTVVQLLSATIITPLLMKWLLKRNDDPKRPPNGSAAKPLSSSGSSSDGSTLPALRIMRGAIPFNCAIHVFNYAFFAAVALSGTKASLVTSVDATWAYLWCVQVPQTVVLSVLRSSVFMCVCAQFAKEASRVSNLTGTAVTILNSIANMGYAIPSSIVMLSSERLMSVLLGTTADASHQWAVISGAVSVGVGIMLYIFVTIPAIKRLEKSTLEEEAKQK